MGKSNALLQRLDHGTGSHDNENVVLIKLKFLAVWVLEGVVIEREEKTLLRDICQGNLLEKQEKSITKAAQKLQYLHTKSVHTMEWSKSDGLLLYWNKVYVPDIPNLCHCVVSLHHDSKITG